MNKTAFAFKQWSEKSKNRLSNYVEGAILEFTECMAAKMKELSVSKTDLAHKLKCTQSYITKVLQGSTNFTLASMVKIAFALDCELTIGFKPKAPLADWKMFNFSTGRAVTVPTNEWVWKQRGNLTKVTSEFTIPLQNERNITITT
jgi:transcriptional regulator with XRE-family HTH domain